MSNLFSKRITRAYIVALCLIGFLTISSQLLVRNVLDSQATDSRVINIAGRQRMLSQLLAKRALKLSLEKTDSSFAIRQERISEALNLWQTSHEALLNGNKAHELPKRQNSQETLNLFEEITPYYESIRKASQQLSMIAWQDSLQLESSLTIILDTETQYLSRMDAIVFQYDKEAKEKVEKLKSLELSLMFVTVLVLLLEAIFIFRPAIKNSEKNSRKVYRKNQELEEEHRLGAEQSKMIAMQNEELRLQSEQLLLSTENLWRHKEQLEDNLVIIQDLQVELSQLAMVVNHTDNSVIITDAEGYIQFVNNGFERVTEYSLEECKGKKPGDILQGMHTDRQTVDFIHQKLAEKVPFTTEILNYSKSGREYWLYMTINPLFSSEGELINFIAIETDITEQKHKESLLEQQKFKLNNTLAELRNTQMQLVQSEKLSSLGLLAAGVAHEVNNPINFISTGAYALKAIVLDIKKLLIMYEELAENPDLLPEKKEAISLFKKEIYFTDIEAEFGLLVEDILTGAERTKNIIDGLRTFSRLDGEDIAPANLHENLDSTLLMIQNQFQERIELVKDYDPQYSTLECNIKQINQALLNLIMNAYQAIEGKGVITLKTRFDSEQVIISILDTGRGIEEQNILRIFEPFFTTEDIGKGTGLGLSIAYGIIKKHQGCIDVDSQLGVGSTFKVSIPLNSFAR